METKTILVFLLISVVLGGGAATMMGRNFAVNWRSPIAVIVAGIGLALGVRFLHYALFQETLLTPMGFLADAIVIIAFSLVGFRWQRADQMTTQYYWLYERTGPLTWRAVTKTGDKT